MSLRGDEIIKNIRNAPKGECCEWEYFCPTSKEQECLIHGGFDICCDDPTCPSNNAWTGFVVGSRVIQKDQPN